MTREIPSFKASEPVAEMTAALDEAGCIVVRDVFDRACGERIQSELEPHMSRALYSDTDSAEDFYPAHTRRISGLISRSEAVRELTIHPVTTALCDHHLLPNCERYNVHVTAGLIVEPGARRQILHREEDPFDYFPVPRPNLVIASMAALTEFTPENGGTLLVPGSHRWEAGREATATEIVSAAMPPEAMLFWLGGTLHGAGANNTDATRYGVILSYSLGWLRQEENQYLDLTDETMTLLSAELRDRVGVTMHGSLGFHDPSLRGLSSGAVNPKNLG